MPIRRRRLLLAGALVAGTGCLAEDDGPTPNDSGDPGNATEGTPPNASDDLDANEPNEDDADVTDDGEDDDPAEERPTSIDSTLYGLTTTANRTAYADRNGYRLRDGTVEVSVRLAPNASMPDDPVIQDAGAYGDRVVGYVAVDDLVALARHRNVSYVETPDSAVEQGGGS